MARKWISVPAVLALSLILLIASPPSNVTAIECICEIHCVYKEYTKDNTFIKVLHRKSIRSVNITSNDCNDDDQWDLHQVCKESKGSSPSSIVRAEAGSAWCVEQDFCTANSALGADAPEIPTLREFRDTVLINTETGQQLEHLYYRYSPTIIQILNSNDFLKSYALNRIVEVSGLIDRHLYGSGLENKDYDHIRSVIEESINMLRNIAARYPQGEQDGVFFDKGITDFLTDETLSEISSLINLLLDELRDDSQFPQADQ